MKNIILISAVCMGLGACRNAGAGSDANPSDTTGRYISPAVEDPNSNMADTMRMVDSTRVKDTIIKDRTTAKPKHQ